MDNKAYALISHLLSSKNFKSNITFAALCGTYFQLMAVIGYLLFRPSLGYQTILEILVALTISTVLGTGAIFYALRALTSPVSLASQALSDYLDKQKLPDLPGNFTDEAGKMMASIQHLIMANDALSNALEKASLLDNLTGVYNRYWCENRLAKDMQRLKQSDETMSIVVIDINGFNAINSLHGHTAGDLCLKHVANMLRFNVRGSDWVARWGRDEFLLVLYNTPRESLIKVMDRIRRLAKERSIITPQGAQLQLSLGVGVCQYFEGDEPETVFYKIEQALYKAKLYGKDKIIHDYISLAG